MSFKTLEYGRNKIQVKNYNEYVANTFEELPTSEQGAKLGDKGYFKNGDSIGIAMYFDGGWVKG